MGKMKNAYRILGILVKKREGKRSW